VVEGVHRWANLTFLVFLLIHSITILLDSFTHFGLKDVLVPFASAYRPLWLGLGIVAAELAIAVAASVWLRGFLGYRAWHVIHALTYVIVPLSLLHGLGTGTDTRTFWATSLYVLSFIFVFGVVIWRTSLVPEWRGPILTVTVAGTLVLLVWGFIGPYAPGWAQRSGTPADLLQAATNQKNPTPEAPADPAFPGAFVATLSGQTIASDNSNILLRGTTSGQANLDVAIQVLQTSRQASGEIQIRNSSHIPLCTGPISIAARNTVTATCSGYGQQMNLELTLQQLDARGFQGVLRST
jgi:sulfoxide reductase heme-binding subunit YedZ